MIVFSLQFYWYVFVCILFFFYCILSLYHLFPKRFMCVNLLYISVRHRSSGSSGSSANISVVFIVSDLIISMLSSKCVGNSNQSTWLKAFRITEKQITFNYCDFSILRPSILSISINGNGIHFVKWWIIQKENSKCAQHKALCLIATIHLWAAIDSKVHTTYILRFDGSQQSNCWSLYGQSHKNSVCVSVSCVHACSWLIFYGSERAEYEQ